MKDRTITVLELLNILGVILVIAVNTLAVVLPLNGKSTAELSDQYPNLFVPAGITFAIWGIIYILFLVFTVYQARDLFAKEKKNSVLHQKINWFFILSCLLNSAWIFAWHYEQLLLSVFIMLLLLATLITIYFRLDIGKTKVPESQKYTVNLLFSVYLGWISIATIANITALLVSIHWNGFGIPPVFWTCAVIAVGAALTMLMLFLRNDVFYSLVVLWAFTGIMLKRSAAGGFESQVVLAAAAISMLAIAIGIIIRGPKYLNG